MITKISHKSYQESLVLAYTNTIITVTGACYGVSTCKLNITRSKFENIDAQCASASNGSTEMSKVRTENL